MGVKDDLMRRLGANLDESMTSKAFRAGQGAVISVPPVTPSDAPAAADRLAGVTRHRAAASIEVERLVPDPNQPRTEFDDDSIERLSRSLQERGQLQPIRVRWDATMSKYVIIAGERRYRAAVRAGLKTVECVMIEKDQTQEEVLEDQLIENCLREDLQPIEQGRAFRTLMDRLGLSYRELAERLHLSHAAVHRTVSLLELPEAVQERVTAGALAPSAAYEISKLACPEDQVEVAAQAADRKLTRDQVVAAVKAKKTGKATPAKRTKMEFSFERVKVTISGEAVNEDDRIAIRTALFRALEQLDTGDRDQAQDEAA